MAFGMFPMILMMLLGGGGAGGNQLLDFADPQAYWQNAAVPYETAAMVSEAQAEVVQAEGANKHSQVRKLMAIRSLGAMKAKEGLPVLAPLAKSDDEMIADAAKIAIAQINGQALPERKIDAKLLEADLALLPAATGIVGQVQLTGGSSVPLRAMFEGMPMGGMGGPANADEVIRRFTSGLTMVADQTGDIRLDALTFAVADNIGNNNGWVVVVARGAFDKTSCEAALAQTPFPKKEVEGLTLYSPESEIAFSLLSNERALFVAGPNQDQMPIAEVAQALKNPNAKPRFSSDLQQEKGKLPKNLTAWVLGSLPAELKRMPPMQAVSSFVLTSEKKEGFQAVTAKAKTDGPDAAKTLSDMVTMGVQAAIGQMQPHVAEAPKMIGPMLEMMQTVKAMPDGDTLVISAQMKDGAVNVGLMMPWMMFSSVRAHDVEMDMHNGAVAEPIAP